MESKRSLNSSGIFDKPVVTEVTEFKSFYKAEGYHQNYSSVNPDQYYAYRKGSGRDEFINKTWGYNNYNSFLPPSDEQLKNELTPIQFQVTRKNYTEKPFENEYWNSKEKGIYVDIISGEPLFSSKDKFRSGTGWPSFTKPLDPYFLSKVIDSSGYSNQIEVRSKYGDAHLGHVFYDGPEPTNLRYCINSAALKFIPENEMAKKGYSIFLHLVD